MWDAGKGHKTSILVPYSATARDVLDALRVHSHFRLFSEKKKRVLAPSERVRCRKLILVSWLYVIECEGGKYYVGITGNPRKRLGAHFGGTGAVWTTIHRPLRVLWCYLSFTPSQDERKETLEMMYLFGQDHVRGGKWTRRDFPGGRKRS